MELETPRLVIRPHTRDNLEALVRWNTDPVIHRLSDDDAAPPDALAVEATLARWLEVVRKDVLHLALHLKASGRCIGFGDLGLIDHHHRRCMVGLVIGERALWGQGYGREALGGLLRLAFDRLRLRRVGAQVYAFNERSLRLFEAAGFTREGVLRGNVEKDGAPADEVVFGMLREEWEARP
jgi:[ribosomal protein S5]-alanine N-acetyltransferase